MATAPRESRRFGCGVALVLFVAVLLTGFLLGGPAHPLEGTWRLDLADLRGQILTLRTREPSADAGEALGDPRLAGVRLGDLTETNLDETLAARDLVLRILSGSESWDVEMEETLPTGVRVRSSGGISWTPGPTLDFCDRIPDERFEVRDGDLLLLRGRLSLRLRRE